MDANKLQKLKNIGYKLRPVCATCRFFRIVTMDSKFSTCKKHVYVHQKHKEKARELSVHSYGWCSDWEENKEIDPFGTSWHVFKGE